MRVARDWLTVALLPCVLLLNSCGDSRRPYDAPTTPLPPPANTAAPVPTPAVSDTATPAPAPSEPVPSNMATDADVKKGTETDKVGDASGIATSDGKPGSETANGDGTGTAVSSPDRTEDKK